ncbi:MAG: WD40 repeat protein [Natronomonas sp.]|jgi:WD40 repeat protein
MVMEGSVSRRAYLTGASTAAVAIAGCVFAGGNSATASDWRKRTTLSVVNDGTNEHVSFSPSADYLAVCVNEYGVEIWDTSDTDPANWQRAIDLTKGAYDSNMRSCEWGPSGDYLGVADASVGLSVYETSAADPSNWREISESPLFTDGFTDGVSWHPDGTHVALANGYNKARVWSTSDWTELSQSPVVTSDRNVETVDFSHSGDYVAVGGDASGEFHVVRTSDWAEVEASPVSHAYGPEDIVRWSDTDSWIGGGTSSNDFYVFDTSNPDSSNWAESSHSPMSDYDNDVEGLAWHLDDAYVATGTLDNRVRIYEPNNSFTEIDESPLLHSSSVRQLDIAKDSNWLAVLLGRANEIVIHETPEVGSEPT